MDEFVIRDRAIGPSHPPLVVAEIGINHNGDFDRALRMIDDAAAAGAECVKFQCHILEEEMIPNEIVPDNADETIWDLIERCQFDEEQERTLQERTREHGMIFLSTPFSRAAVDRLERMDVPAFKVGSGEMNNHPLIEYIASKQKPVILSTGMNPLEDIREAVAILESAGCPYALLHCTSLYPTPYDKVRLGVLDRLREAFPSVPVGLSDHSLKNYAAFGAVARGACIVEKHYVSDKSWEGPDVPISINPDELESLIEGVEAVYRARGDSRVVLDEEKTTAHFAFASVVTTRAVEEGETLTRENLWVKRPGTGEILAPQYEEVLGRKVNRDLPKNTQLRWDHLGNGTVQDG